MKKQKDLKVGSEQWVAAWKKVLSEGFIMRCMLEPSLNSLRFWMESFLMDDANDIQQIRLEWFLGDTIALPKVSVAKYDAPLVAFLDDLENFWVGEGMHRYLVIRELAFAVPHRGFIRPSGSPNIFLLPTNHPALMMNYGAVHEWLYQARRGRVVATNGMETNARGQRVLWTTFEHRFKDFLYRQQLSVIESCVGKVVSVHD